MKFITPTKLLAVAFLATTLCPLSTARAQAPVDYRLDTSAVTLALVIKKTAPGTSLRNFAGGGFVSPKVPTVSNDWITGPTNQPTSYNYEYVTRMGTTRYGNAQLLEDLKNAAVIDETRGWSVVLKYNPVTNSYPVLDENNEPLLDDNGDPLEETYESYEPVLAIRKGTEIIEVDVEKANFEFTPLASASAANSSGKMSSTQSTASGKYTSESAVSMTVTAPTLGSVVLNGLMSDSSSSFYWYPIAADRLVQDSISVPVSTKITGLVGAEDFDPDSDSDSGPGVITGAITVGASKAVKK